MTNFNLTKTIFYGLVLTLATFLQAKAEIKTGKCGDNCTYTFDTESKDVIISGTGELRGMPQNLGPTRNVIVGEGITSIYQGFYTSDWGILHGTLMLPSTLVAPSAWGINQTSFDTIVVDTASLTGVSWSNLDSLNLKNLIVIADKNTKSNFDPEALCDRAKGTCPSKVSIQCKGERSSCMTMLKPVTDYMSKKGSSVTFDNYIERDKDGNIIAEWREDGVIKYNYDTGGNLTSIYDVNGVAIYTKTLYTLPEAAAAVKNDNNNTVTITFK